MLRPIGLALRARLRRCGGFASFDGAATPPVSGGELPGSHSFIASMTASTIDFDVLQRPPSTRGRVAAFILRTVPLETGQARSARGRRRHVEIEEA